MYVHAFGALTVALRVIGRRPCARLGFWAAALLDRCSARPVVGRSRIHVQHSAQDGGSFSARQREHSLEMRAAF